MKEKDNKETINNKGEAAEKKGKSIGMTILNTFINILIIIVLVVSLVVATLALTSKANNGVPSIFGYSFHTIQTSSMEGGSDEYQGGNYDVGDLVIGKTTSGNPNEVYEMGDIVVYTTEDENISMIVHRIVAIDDSTGERVYTTKGDNNEVEDKTTHTAAQIVAVTYDHNYQGAVLKGLGKALDFIRTGQGFFFVVLLPMIIFFLYEIVRVVLNAVNYRNAKAMEEIEQSKEDQQAAIDAAVAAALAAQNASAKTEDKHAADKTEDKPEAKAEEKAEDKAEAKADAAPADLSPEQLEQFKQFMAFQKAQQEQEDK